MTESHAQIGKMLKAAREATGVRLEDASRALHIRARYLQALEEGRLEDLPGRAYAKGYLLAYAGYLDMDKQELLRQFEAIEENFRRGFFLPEVLNREKKASRHLAWGGLVVAIAVVMLWVSIASYPYSDPEDIAALQQQFDKNGHISGLMGKNVPCLKLEVALYPPCYAVELDYSLLPLKRRVTSVMELKM
jgi:cytoskeleton protein RodZ